MGAPTSTSATPKSSPTSSPRPYLWTCIFIDRVDLSGKTVHPFVTYAVSGLGDTALAAHASIGEPLAVRGEDAHNAQPDVETWLQQIGLTPT
ncbi:hypothetical protein [Mycobacterium sp. 155]|uniref:hypothetical protein n=1 Tax=Mycobacterium sp. 155 TaxID=1157943 RepID=UPI0003A2404A|nr:hypothetical protein [Mycobacterium sp. 155]